MKQITCLEFLDYGNPVEPQQCRGGDKKMQISVSVVSSVVSSTASVKFTSVMDHPKAEQPLDAAMPEGWRW